MTLSPSAGLQSPLLNSLGWVRHCFLPAGVRPPPDTAYGQQRHSTIVSEAGDNFPPKQSVADALISSLRPVAVYTADCLPLLIASRRTRQVAAVHAGLQGTLDGVIEQTLLAFRREGSDASDLYVAIGPAIGPCCYELGLPVAERIAASHQVSGTVPRSAHAVPNPRAIRACAPETQPAFWLDLPAMATQMLISAGVPPEQIDNLHYCTYCMAEEGASYRRNTHTGEGYQLRFSWIAGAAGTPPQDI